jgi:hypothetical protein
MNKTLSLAIAGLRGIGHGIAAFLWMVINGSTIQLKWPRRAAPIFFWS